MDCHSSLSLAWGISPGIKTGETPPTTTTTATQTNVHKERRWVIHRNRQHYLTVQSPVYYYLYKSFIINAWNKLKEVKAGVMFTTMLHHTSSIQLQFLWNMCPVLLDIRCHMLNRWSLISSASCLYNASQYLLNSRQLWTVCKANLP